MSVNGWSSRAPLWGAFSLAFAVAGYQHVERAGIWQFLKKNPTAPIMCLATLIAYNGLRTQRKIARVKNALDFQNNYLSSETSKGYIVNVVQIANTKPADELSVATLKGQDLLCVREVLNSFERMAIGIDIKAYDPEVLFRSYASTVLTVWKALRPYIRERQKSTPHVYCHIDKLAADWMMKTEKKRSRRNDRGLFAAAYDAQYPR
ncbi:hypothetical protein W822_07640 [Advenella kashmirensis W13003]|uniref:DUF4760 domain-containing protein n=1 Tax=Advenella kashmirensis W13003 TaxID=1424334 RepID=V8QWS0_9BURK|nr:DUF4760 domain-containing protein [Advenella kashmirensis]ETF03459.1 hypothetical protein W822_07640 [Advenella kashmirensis W13003]